MGVEKQTLEDVNSSKCTWYRPAMKLYLVQNLGEVGALNNSGNSNKCTLYRTEVR